VEVLSKGAIGMPQYRCWKFSVGVLSTPLTPSGTGPVGSPLADVINCAEFFVISSGVLILWGVEICIFLQELKVAINTV